MKIILILVLMLGFLAVYAQGYKHGELKTRLENIEEQEKEKKKQEQQKINRDRFKKYIDECAMFPPDRKSVRLRQEKQQLNIRKQQ